MSIRDYVTPKERLLGLRSRKKSKWFFLLNRSGYNKALPTSQFKVKAERCLLFPAFILLCH